MPYWLIWESISKTGIAERFNFHNFLATMLTVFTAKYTPNHASGGTFDPSDASISLF
jgi:hypothetical protein